jgi:hypothetical protein
MRVLVRLLALAGLVLALVLFLALLVSNYSLTPGSAKLDAALVILVLAGAVLLVGRGLVVEIRTRRDRWRGAS